MNPIDLPSSARAGDGADPRPLDVLGRIEATGGESTWIEARAVRQATGTRLLAEAADHRRLDHDGLVVDALLHRPGPTRFALTGQIVARDGRALSGLSVVLHIDGVAVARTRTDGFGEFDFGERRAGRVGLRIERAGRSIRVDLGMGGGE